MSCPFSFPIFSPCSIKSTIVSQLYYCIILKMANLITSINTFVYYPSEEPSVLQASILPASRWFPCAFYLAQARRFRRIVTYCFDG